MVQHLVHVQVLLLGLSQFLWNKQKQSSAISSRWRQRAPYLLLLQAPPGRTAHQATRCVWNLDEWISHPPHSCYFHPTRSHLCVPDLPAQLLDPSADTHTFHPPSGHQGPSSGRGFSKPNPSGFSQMSNHRGSSSRNSGLPGLNLLTRRTLPW